MTAGPLELLNNLLPSYATDSVAVFTSDYTQIFKNARSIKVVVKEASKVMEHPLENGSMIIDHRIVLPIEIDMTMLLLSADYQDVYKQIRQYYLNATLIYVQTRSNIYTNQLIQSMPHEEDPSMYNALSLELNLKQVQFVSPSYTRAPRNASNTPVVQRGAQQAAPPKFVTPVLKSTVNAAKNFVGVK